MLPKYDLFMFGLTRDDYALSSVSLAWAKEWAKTNRVFYFDRPYSIKDVKTDFHLENFRKRLPAILTGHNPYTQVNIGESTFTRVTPQLTLPLNFLSEGNLYHTLNRFNNWVLANAINRTIRDYKVENFVYFNSFHPVLLPYLGKGIRKKPLASIYQSLDEISQEAYIARHGIAAESVAMKGCDIAIGTSSHLCARHEQESKRKVHLLANAADYSTFKNAMNRDLEMPIEMRAFTKPVIVYTGHYSDLRMDHELVKKLSAEFLDYEILFVGTYEAGDLKRFGISELTNLHFIGSRPIEQLPNYLKHAKVAIIPYASNTLTAGIYPLKINEYLAAGIPCVSTNFSKDIASFKEVIYLAESHSDFIDKIKIALQEDINLKLEARMAVAASNSWRMRITKLEGLIEDFVAGKPV
jgi:glycosyltransferase involved in cell wall biosynthesis